MPPVDRSIARKLVHTHRLGFQLLADAVPYVLLKPFLVFVTVKLPSSLADTLK
jgi:hypothetical protein